MTHRTKIWRSGLLLGLCMALLGATGCTKDPATTDTGAVPHKPVPAEFQGNFYSVHSRGAYRDQYGGYHEGISWGTVFNIKPNGTGTSVIRYDITYASGAQKKVHVDCDAAFEITKLGNNRADILVHFIRGKNYEDGKFLHDLDASKIYPNGDVQWLNVEYGTNAQGKAYFIATADDTYTKD